jgi:hypothetical protein
VTIEAVTALLVAVTALVGAWVSLYREVRKTHELVNSRVDELVALTRAASRAEGRLAAKQGNGEGQAG